MPESMFEHILIQRENSVGTITLNRPEVLNACNSQTHTEIHHAFDMLEGDEGVRAIVLIGAGRAFCAGSDLREVGGLRGSDARRYVHLDYTTKNRVAGCSKPVIAGIRGHCVGGGMELALACDMRLATDEASFSLREIVLGTIPGSGGLQRLPSVVGLGIAKEWVLTGRPIASHEAYQRGLVNKVVAGAKLESEVQAFAETLAQRSPIATHLAKVALDPVPPANYGLTATYHMLASAVCHGDSAYGEQTRSYVSDDATA